MPTYLYECGTCGEFEEFHSISIKLEFCPKCESTGQKHEVKRLISPGGSRGVVELTGNELVAQMKSDTAKLQRDASKSEKVYANLLGESNFQKLTQQIDRSKKR
jgi:putative FmdB family regulatory protein